MFNSLPSDIKLNIWSYDNTINENYNKLMVELLLIFKEKKSLIINISEYVRTDDKNNLNVILKETLKYIRSLNLIKNHWKRINDSKIKEYEIYYKNNKIQYYLYYISYPNYKLLSIK